MSDTNQPARTENPGKPDRPVAPARRTSVPRALALFAGTIGFVAAAVLGLLGGNPTASTLARAGACGVGLGALALVAGALGVRVVKESQTPPAAKEPAVPVKADGGGAPAAGAALPGAGKAGSPAETGQAGASGGGEAASGGEGRRGARQSMIEKKYEKKIEEKTKE